jgi:hypothetical protein
MPQEASLAAFPVLPVEIISGIFEKAAKEPSALPRLALVSHQVRAWFVTFDLDECMRNDDLCND